MKPMIEMWDESDFMIRHFHVAIPGRWFVYQKNRLGLTWLMIKLIWGIGATQRPGARG